MRIERALVLDANILLRAVFGIRVRELLNQYERKVRFCAPEAAVFDSRKYVRSVAAQRGADAEIALRLLDQVLLIVQPVENGFYRPFEADALPRISGCDRDDWPIIATAMLLNAPIWTEDQDFFGCGIATWVTATVEIYLRSV